jgi:hypothetical protein
MGMAFLQVLSAKSVLVKGFYQCVMQRQLIFAGEHAKLSHYISA